MGHKKKSPAGTGRLLGKMRQKKQLTAEIIPQSLIFDNRKQRRASLRLAAQRIAFYGRRKYRLAREAMSLADDVSIFELDNNDLADLAGRMREL